MTTEEAIKALKMMNLAGAHPFLHWEEMLEVRDMAITALRAQLESNLKVLESNEPLTPDELREMDGEPVYSTKEKRWFLVVHWRGSNTSALVDVWGEAILPQSAMPLYRRKPEEGTR